MDWFEKLVESLLTIKAEVLSALPMVLSFLAILFVGALVSFVLRKVTYKILVKTNVILKEVSSESEKKKTFLPERVIKAITKVTFWVALVFFFMVALDFTGFQKIDLGFNQFFYFVPRFVAGITIFFIGWVVSLYIHSLIFDFCGEHKLKQAVYLSGSAKWLVLIIFFDLALMQLGMKTTIITNLILIFVGAILGGLVISFALGSREYVNNTIASYTIQRHYEVGQKVQIESYEGTILRFTPTGIVLLTKQGETFVPAKSVLEAPSTLLITRSKK